jgi:hypothetical protein
MTELRSETLYAAGLLVIQYTWREKPHARAWRGITVKIRPATLVGAALTALISCYALADEQWAGTGHEHITAGAVNHLPQPLRGFFQANSTALESASGTEPPGTHYIDIDYYPEFFAGTFPHDLDELIALYGLTVVNQNGTAPWTVGTYTADLSALMAAAHTEQAWLDLLPTAGALAHYVEDLHNPLHLTMNYDGQLTGNDGIHSRYESKMISRHLPSGLPIVPQPDHCMHYASVIDAVFDSIDVHYWYVDDIMAADTAAYALDPNYHNTYYNKLWADTGPFTRTLFQQASEMVASAWYTAWVDAGSPTPIPPPVVMGDLDCNGQVNTADIGPFVLALVDPAAYMAGYPQCDIGLADMNGDTKRDGADIQAFVIKLLTP